MQRPLDLLFVLSCSQLHPQVDHKILNFVTNVQNGPVK